MIDYIQCDYLNWKVPDEIFIQTPTGSGKTTFVLEELAAHALSMGKEVLLLVNRKILKKQIQHDLAAQHGIEKMNDEELEKIKHFDGVTVLSYQEVQQELKRKSFFLSRINDPRYFYVVFDEAHYLLQDATFNRDIVYMLEAIPKIDRSAKIFTSATMEEAKPFLMKILHPNEDIGMLCCEKGREKAHFQKTLFTGGDIYSYKLEPHYNICNIRYFQTLETLAEHINIDDTDEKWLIFVNSKLEAKKLQKLIKHEGSYIDADVDEDDVIREQIIRDERFSGKILITTKVLDNGINIKDCQLRNLVLLTVDKTDFIQMLGRKRFDGEERGLNLYLAARDARFFNYLRNMKLQPMMRCIKELRNDNEFRQERLEDETFCQFCMKMAIFDGKFIRLSEAAKEKLYLSSQFCQKMLDSLKADSDAFIREQLSWLGEGYEFNKESYLENEKQVKKKGELEMFLSNIAGEKMDKEDQSKFRMQIMELAEKMGKKLTDRKTRCAGKVALNRFFRTEGLPFCIESVGNSKFWLVREVNENVTVDVCD